MAQPMFKVTLNLLWMLYYAEKQSLVGHDPDIFQIRKRLEQLAWGEGLFLIIQTATVAALTLHYGASAQQAVLFVGTFVGITSALMGGLVPVSYLWTMQVFNVPIIVIGKQASLVDKRCEAKVSAYDESNFPFIYLGSHSRPNRFAITHALGPLLKLEKMDNSIRPTHHR
uniref:Uncharacterized protein n=1 Tax=Timema shepardi TaxID=629360 RepID=A0A7R9ASU0_TIMSH|nr:unnamed protein product [Timema shepardi]